MTEKFQIKNADGKYVSIGMDGKPKWFESPDMGYTYTEEEAETFKVILEGMDFTGLSVVKYDKDWWKPKMNLGGGISSELARGIEVEKEHVGTLEKLVNGEITLEEAPKHIAMDHLKESETYYTELDKMESKFSGGGKITSAWITKQPESIGDEMPKVFVTIDGKEEYLFEYYPDEISFTPEDFIGKTTDQARHLKFEKDKMYLQSHSYASGGQIEARDSVVGKNYWFKNHKQKWTEFKVVKKGDFISIESIATAPGTSIPLYSALISQNELLNENKPKHINSSAYHLAGGGKPDEQKKYYSTSRAMPFSEFISIEVDERSNYEEEDVNLWKKKYGITDDSKVIWVALEPHIAARYQMDADDWKNAKELYEADPEKYEVDEYSSSKGTLIEESDDGDDGFVMVLKDSYADGGDFLESADLYMKEGPHDKEYHIQIVRRGDGYGVVAQWGRRGSHLQEDDKGVFSTLELARNEFEKIAKSKIKKGYYLQRDDDGKPEPKPKPKFKKGDYVKLKNDAELLIVDESEWSDGDQKWGYNLEFAGDRKKKAWHYENAIIKYEFPFKEGDFFKTQSGDEYQIKMIHTSDVNYMVYESVSGIQTDIDIPVAVRFFEEGSWKLVKDAPNEYYNLIGRKVKVTNEKGKIGFFAIENIPKIGEMHLEDTGSSPEGVSISIQDYAGDGLLVVHRNFFSDFVLGKEIESPSGISFLLLEKGQEPQKKLTRIEYYEKYGF